MVEKKVECCLYQAVNLWVIDEERFAVSFLVLDESLDVHVEALGHGIVGALSCLLASFK